MPATRRCSLFLRIGLAVLFFTLLLPAYTARAASPLDPAFDQAVAKYRFSGAILAVSAPDQPTWVGARGLANRTTGEAATPEHAFRLASISKMFVATVAMQLVQEGWLALDQNVEQWLPGLVPGGARVSVRSLLNHTSGVPDYLTESFMRVVLANPSRVWAPSELVAAGLRVGPVQPPGNWSYSNTNYVLLGMIIERVTGHTLHNELHQRILDPLGLAHTFVEPEDVVTLPLMQGYENGRDLADKLTMSFAFGAGNITSTASDLAIFLHTLFKGGLLQPATLAMMEGWTNTGGAWGVPSFVYGLGMMQRTLDPTNPTLVRGHTGALAGYRNALWYVPEHDVVIVASINDMDDDPNALVVAALRALQGQWYAEM